MAQKDREKLNVLAERTIMVGVVLPGVHVDENDPLSELRALATTAGAEIVGEMLQRRGRPIAGTFLGKGKMQDLGAMVKELKATLVVFDNDLSPAQVRNLERAVACKIVDRSELILDIFANRATTAEAKLQVEIAQLEYTYPRLRAMWDHLGQVTGGAPLGIGTRGPGEQQLEIDRRLVKNRLEQLKGELKRIHDRKTREVAQRNRSHFTVGLVGYTNAGKSTLFNRLTVGGGAFEHGKLFATLGTRVERWELGGGTPAMLSDTVGFIRALPHHLVASFKSTLEETVSAQVLLLVLDVSDPATAMQLDTVRRTLDDIGATTQPRIIVLNKIDCMDEDRAARQTLKQWKSDHPDAIAVSAATGDGLDHLRETVHAHALGDVREMAITTPLVDSRTVDFLEKRAEVLDRQYTDDDAVLTVRIGRRQLEALLAQGARVRINGHGDARRALKEEWGILDPLRPVRAKPHERD